MLFMGFLGLIAMLVPGIFGVVYPDEPDWLDYVTVVLCTLIGLGVESRVIISPVEAGHCSEPGM